jgi:hypothetical protein
MKYHLNDIEAKWRKYWEENQTFKAENKSDKQKFYVLDMFPYPSGAGLHVGHPLGYIASDIYARYKRHKGFNVLHPMGYDSFGLPAEQYAIQTGQHPAVTTATNIKRYKEQLNKIGFSYDWSREVQTCEPAYYRWTQWIFIQLFESWYDKATQQARPISALIQHLEAQGTLGLQAHSDENAAVFTAGEWLSMSEAQQADTLMHYRLAGAVANVALIFYVIIVLAIFRLVPVTLTLAGIAGFVLSIGMAVDANILIFERTKEELRIGKGIVPAVEAGFNRAWNSILDSNVSSLITAFILFYFGSSTIKGFALVLIIGVLCSLFTAITVTRLILRAVIARKRFSSPYLYGVAKGDLDALDRGALHG